MATVTVLIAERDLIPAREFAAEASHLMGVQEIAVRHKPFDPRGPDADSQPFEEYRIVITYDPTRISQQQLHDLVHARQIHILDMYDHAPPGSGQEGHG